jgi:hypothetical protein
MPGYFHRDLACSSVVSMTQSATPEDIEQEFPGWHAWQGVNDLYYARLPKTSPPWVVTGEDLAALREQIASCLRDGPSRVDLTQNPGCSI